MLRLVRSLATDTELMVEMLGGVGVLYIWVGTAHSIKGTGDIEVQCQVEGFQDCGLVG